MTIERYGRRFWALYDNHDLVCVTVYKRGAVEVARRLGAAPTVATRKATTVYKWPAATCPERQTIDTP